MGQGLAERLDQLELMPGNAPSASLVDNVLVHYGLSNMTRRRRSLLATLVPTFLGAGTGMVAGLGLKLDMQAGVEGASLLSSPFATYGILVALAALVTSAAGGLPRLREFAFLSSVMIAAIALT